MSAKQYHRLRDLHPGSYNWTVKVRIIRVWRGALKTGEEFKSLNMLLLDDKNTRMHAFVPATILEAHEEKLKEGNICTFSNLSVKDYKNEEKFRVVNNDRQILLTNYTQIETIAQDDPLIAKNMFDFYDLCDLKDIANQNVYLTDVIGVIYKDNPLRRIKNKNDQVKFTIVDGRSSIDVTFWDVMAKQFVDALENADEFPAIIIIASAKISSWQGTNHTTPQVDISNCSSTKFYMNYDDHTVSQLRRMITTPLFSQYNFSNQIRHKIQVLSTKEIQKLGKESADEQVVCDIKVTSVPELQKWYYYECPSCYKEIEPREEVLSCYRCNREVPSPYKKFQVYVKGEDHTGEIDICLFDRAIKTLIGKNVDELGDEGETHEELPLLLKTIDKQSLAVKLQIRIQNVENKSKLYYGIDVSANTKQIITEDTNEITESMQISATQTSESTFHLDNFSQLNFQTPEVTQKKIMSKLPKKK